MFGACWCLQCDRHQRRMTVCIRVGKCWQWDILLCSFPCCWLCVAAGSRRSATPPCRRSLAGLSLYSWSTPQSNVWGWKCLCLTQIWGHTHKQKERKQIIYFQTSLQARQMWLLNMSVKWWMLLVSLHHMFNLLQRSPIQFPPSFSPFYRDEIRTLRSTIRLFFAVDSSPPVSCSHVEMPTLQCSKEVPEVRTFPNKTC